MARDRHQHSDKLDQNAAFKNGAGGEKDVQSDGHFIYIAGRPAS